MFFRFSFYRLRISKALADKIVINYIFVKSKYFNENIKYFMGNYGYITGFTKYS